ncbi:hypothetical protein HZ326_0097 [Fusarium oxysporum f. sp. albedinis]|nr:hypothetical protein HZ326_0097 [Fusarium oxysporum f. sp. albedinis]
MSSCALVIRQSVLQLISGQLQVKHWLDVTDSARVTPITPLPPLPPLPRSHSANASVDCQLLTVPAGGTPFASWSLLLLSSSHHQAVSPFIEPSRLLSRTLEPPPVCLAHDTLHHR